MNVPAAVSPIRVEAFFLKKSDRASQQTPSRNSRKADQDSAGVPGDDRGYRPQTNGTTRELSSQPNLPLDKGLVA